MESSKKEGSVRVGGPDDSRMLGIEAEEGSFEHGGGPVIAHTRHHPTDCFERFVIDPVADVGENVVLCHCDGTFNSVRQCFAGVVRDSRENFLAVLYDNHDGVSHVGLKRVGDLFRVSARCATNGLMRLAEHSQSPDDKKL